MDGSRRHSLGVSDVHTRRVGTLTFSDERSAIIPPNRDARSTRIWHRHICALWAESSLRALASTVVNSLSIAMRFRELKQEDAENYAKALRDSGHKDTCGHKKPHRCPLFLRTADGKHESNIACGVSRAYAWTVVSKALVSWGCAAPPLCNVRAL